MKSLVLSLMVAGSVSVAFSQTAKTKIACMGDSITAGVGAPGEFSYPKQLGQLLGEGYEIKNYGNSGSTLLRSGDKPYDKQKQYPDMLAFAADIYIIKLGTNDTKPQNWAKKDDFKPSALAMIDAIRAANANAKIYICLPVPAFPSNFGITDEVIKNGVIPQLKEIAAEKKTEVIDLYAALDGKGDLVPDKVHPNAGGYRLMTGTIYKALTGKEADFSKLPPLPEAKPKPAQQPVKKAA